MLQQKGSLELNLNFQVLRLDLKFLGYLFTTWLRYVHLKLLPSNDLQQNCINCHLLLNCNKVHLHILSKIYIFLLIGASANPAGLVRCATSTLTTARRTPAPTAASASTKWTTTPAFVRPDLPERNANIPSITVLLSLARTEDHAQVSLRMFWFFMLLVVYFCIIFYSMHRIFALPG